MGDSFSGRTAVSKTANVGSIPTSPAMEKFYRAVQIVKNIIYWFRDLLDGLYDRWSKSLKVILFLLAFYFVLSNRQYLDIRKVVCGVSGIPVENCVVVKSEPSKPVPGEEPEKVLKQNSETVFEIRGEFKLTTTSCFFEKMLVVGNPDYDQVFSYDNKKFKIVNIQDYIGLLFEGGKAEGPVVRGVSCSLVN